MVIKRKRDEKDPAKDIVRKKGERKEKQSGNLTNCQRKIVNRGIER
jgi:hypothetical protein